MPSLRKRLLIILLSLFLLTWFSMGIASYFTTRHEIEEVFDAQLAQALKIIEDLIQHEIEEMGMHETSDPSLLESGPLHEYENKLVFQVWRHNELFLLSSHAPEKRITAKDGFSDSIIDNEQWRLLSYSYPKQDVQVIVGQNYDVRNEMVFFLIINGFWPILLALPVLVLLFRLGINRGLRPLDQMADDIAARNPQQLSPIDKNNTPREIIPIIDALNDLLLRLGNALEGERRFTADAAHELRTPLAVLKTQAQVANRADNREDRMKALQHIIAGTDRVTHLIEQLLILARLDPDRAATLHKTVDLADIVQSVSADVAHTALDKDIHFELHHDPDCRLPGDETALAILARNLIDNAIRYTPANGRIDITIRQQAAALTLCVTDNGPGIPEHERKRVLDRFYRIVGNQEIGSGLGLSIVKRITDMHHGTMEISTPENGQGVMICIRLPVGAQLAA